MRPMPAPEASDAELLALLREAASAVRSALDDLADWGLAGTRDWQYRHDLVADAAALGVIERAGLAVLSEESGRHGPAEGLVVVVDPVDGSTNASRGIPWFNTSLCIVDTDGPRVAVVVDQAHGRGFEAVRGRGATLDGRPIAPTGCTDVGDAVVGLNGFPDHHLGWKQYRALGAAALDLCSVACGVLDGYVECSASGLAPWDYLGGLLVCTEAGAAAGERSGRDLVTTGAGERRSPVVAATPELLAGLLAAQDAR